MMKRINSNGSFIGMLFIIMIAVALIMVFHFYGQHVFTSERDILSRDQIVLSNALLLDESISKFIEREGISPTSLQQLVDSGVLDAIPVNPYTRKPMKPIRVDDIPSFGEYSYFSSYVESKDNGVINRKQSGYWLLVFGTYGNPKCVGSAANILGNDIGNHVLFQSGTVFFCPPLITTGRTVSFQSPESILVENGYQF